MNANEAITCDPKRILYIQYTNPATYPPLEHSSRILADAGWQVRFLGTGAQGANALEFPPHDNIGVRRWKFCPAGWRQKLHYIAFGLWVIWSALRWRPNWIYASDLLSCPVAFLLKRAGLRVLYHEHDSPVRDQKSKVRSQRSAFQAFLMRSRAKLACHADLCVLPNERRAEAFKESTRTKKPVHCVWNCPLRQEAKAVPEKQTGKFVVFYHGSIVPNRLPLTVIDAMALLPKTGFLRIAGYETVGYRGYSEKLRERARQLGMADRLEFLGAIPHRADLLASCRQANLGLALMPLQSEDLNEQAMAGASNKPFDYLACGLALLVSDLPDWGRMFVKPGHGLFCNPINPEDIAAALRWFVEHPNETCRMGERGCTRIQTEWNYETQFAPVLSTLSAWK